MTNKKIQEKLKEDMEMRGFSHHTKNEKNSKEYKEKHKLMFHIQKTINTIEKCITAELREHKDVCDNCRHVKISYNSCKNRHCSKT